MQLNFSDDQLKTLMNSAIAAALSEEKRNELITEAIKTILEGDKYSKSMIEQAFDSQLKYIINDMVSDMIINNKEIQDALNKGITEAIKKKILNKEISLEISFSEY